MDYKTQITKFVYRYDMSKSHIKTVSTREI
jgi:hypothetical protein